jgi:hypothetical protein
VLITIMILACTGLRVEDLIRILAGGELNRVDINEGKYLKRTNSRYNIQDSLKNVSAKIYMLK